MLYILWIMAQVYGDMTIQKLVTKFNFRAILYYFGIHPETQLLALEGDMGCNSCKIRQHINMIHLWNRLIKMDENRLTKRVFK